MYVKRYVVRRGATQYVYLRLVEAYRDQHGQVRYRVLHTLGRDDQLKRSGQLDQLAAALHRLDPPMAGTRRDVGHCCWSPATWTGSASPASSTSSCHSAAAPSSPTPRSWPRWSPTGSPRPPRCTTS